MPRLRLATSLVCTLLVTTSGCRTGQVAEKLATHPDLAASTGQAKCGVKASAAKPLVVEWPAADRAALEARASRGLIAVRYEGCDMEVLTNCTAAGTYSYLPLTFKREGVRIKNADELYANLPVGAAKLEAKLERDGQLNVDMVIVGRKEADKSQFSDSDLDGRCSEATHVVTGITVGAFSFYTGASAEIGAGATVGNIGAGVSSAHAREVLNQDGNESSCKASDPGASGPPTDCGALLRVEVVPIDRFYAGPTTTPTGGGSTGTTDTPSNGPTTTTVTADPQLERKIKMWRGISIGSYVGALAGAGLLYGGIFVSGKAKKGIADTEPGTPRQDAIAKYKLGVGLLAGGAAAIAVFLALGLFATARSKKLAQSRTAFIAPSYVRGGAGLTAGFRF